MQSRYSMADSCFQSASIKSTYCIVPILFKVRQYFMQFSSQAQTRQGKTQLWSLPLRGGHCDSSICGSVGIDTREWEREAFCQNSLWGGILTNCSIPLLRGQEAIVKIVGCSTDCLSCFCERHTQTHKTHTDTRAAISLSLSPIPLPGPLSWSRITYDAFANCN